MIPKSIRSKKYPKFIRNNKYFIHNIIPNKNFESIGLPNCSSKIRSNQINNQSNMIDFINVLQKHAKYAIEGLKKVNYFLDPSASSAIAFSSAKNKEIGIADTKLSEWYLLNSVKNYDELNDDFYSLLYEINAIINKYLPNSTFCKIFDLCKSAKDFNKYFELPDSPEEDIRVVFSSKGNQAQWDIATMSMRGVSSCQRWAHSAAKHLVGSIVDPNAAIMYLTDGNTTKYGSKMLRRAVVRIVKDNKTKETVILIERIYPFMSYNINYTDMATLSIFKSFIQKRIKNKYKIIYAYDIDFNAKNYSIPMCNELTFLKKSNLSYIDSKVKYKFF